MTISRSALGYVVAGLTSVSFASGTALAVVAYNGGASPLSVTTFRTSFALIAIFVLIKATGGVWRVGHRDRWMLLAIGLVLAIQSLAHYMGIRILPLALATLVFFTHPFFIAVVSHFTGRDRITPGIIASLAVAFCGLILVLDVGGTMTISTVGVLCSLTAAIGFAAIALTTQPIVRRLTDLRTVSLHLHVTATAIFILACIAADDFALPDTQLGWTAFLVVPLFYTAGAIGVFYAIAMVGPVRMSLVMNLEPLAAIIFGIVMLGQDMTRLQLVGAVLILGAIVAVRWDKVKAPVG